MKTYFLCFALLAACSAVANGQYQGVPQYVVVGTISTLPGAPTTAQRPYVGLAWFGNNPAQRNVVVGQTARVGAVSFPTQFQFEIFDPPPAEAFALEGAGQAVFAYMFLFDDRDGDGRFQIGFNGHPGIAPPDLGIGVAWWELLVYVREKPSPDNRTGWLAMVTNPEALTPGYHVLKAQCPNGATGAAELEVRPVDDLVDITLQTPTNAAPPPPAGDCLFSFR
jgi:hypothetical protein